MSAGYHHFHVAGVETVDTGIGDAENAANAAHRAGYCRRLAFAVAARWPGQVTCAWLPANARPTDQFGRAEYPAEQSAHGILRAEETAAAAAETAAWRARIAAEVAALPKLETRAERRARERAERYGDVQLPPAPPANTPFAALFKPGA